MFRDETGLSASPPLWSSIAEAIDRVGDELVIKGKSFGTMPMQARLDASSARAGLKLLGLGKLAFLASLPFRSGSKD